MKTSLLGLGTSLPQDAPTCSLERHRLSLVVKEYPLFLPNLRSAMGLASLF